MLFDNNDSADARVKQFLKAVPGYVRAYIENVEFGQDGVKIQWKQTTPHEIKAETQKHIRS